MDWSRSRYWLCHFLNSRHQRPSIDWDGAIGCPDVGVSNEAKAIALVRAWLSRRWPGDDLGDAHFIAAAADRYADDPAYVQSLRLLAKERSYWADLLRRLRETNGLPTPSHSDRRRRASIQALRVTRRLGPRFELSLLMLTALAHHQLIAALADELSGPTPRTVLEIIQREQSDHLAFYLERLTLELADLNFVRRSLRRLRLRLLFAGVLADAVYSYSPMLESMGVKRRQFAFGTWRQFESALNRVVPYRRQELLAALLNQRQRPYEPAPRL